MTVNRARNIRCRAGNSGHWPLLVPALPAFILPSLRYGECRNALLSDEARHEAEALCIVVNRRRQDDRGPSRTCHTEAPLPSGRDQQGRPACRSRAIWAVIQSSRACHTDDPCHNSIRYFVTHPRAPERGPPRFIGVFAATNRACCCSQWPRWHSSTSYISIPTFPKT